MRRSRYNGSVQNIIFHLSRRVHTEMDILVCEGEEEGEKNILKIIKID